MIRENGTGTGATGTYYLLNLVSTDNATKNTYISYSQAGTNHVGKNASLFNGIIVGAANTTSTDIAASVDMTFAVQTTTTGVIGMRVVAYNVDTSTWYSTTVTATLPKQQLH